MVTIANAPLRPHRLRKATTCAARIKYRKGTANHMCDKRQNARSRAMFAGFGALHRQARRHAEAFSRRVETSRSAQQLQ